MTQPSKWWGFLVGELVDCPTSVGSAVVQQSQWETMGHTPVIIEANRTDKSRTMMLYTHKQTEYQYSISRIPYT